METRSRMMSSIRGRDTKPEMVVRRYVHQSGLRYRLHDRRLPGTPDLVFPKYRLALFVHGCFWHRHSGCANSVHPKSNAEFWQTKLQGNVARDRRNEERLLRLGWRVRVVWECQTQDLKVLEHIVNEIHSGPANGTTQVR